MITKAPLSLKQQPRCPPHDTVEVVKLTKRWHGYQHLHRDTTKVWKCPKCKEITEVEPILELPLFHTPCGVLYDLVPKETRKK